MSQRLDGLAFEVEFCHQLFHKGFWVLNVPQDKSGQPVDVIAVKNNEAYLIECKHCKGDRFLLNRIEPNQETAIYLSETLAGNTNHFFAIYLDGIWLIPFQTAMRLKNREIKSISKKDISKYGYSVEGWLNAFCTK